MLEFWATWCPPCVAEIPIVNALAASVDPAKVHIISVDDEELSIVQKFLAKKPIDGWIGLYSSSTLFKNFGANARPATIIVDANGKVVSNDIPPEQLKGEQLMALAEGKPVKLGGAVDPAVQAALAQRQAQAFAEQAAPHGQSSTKPLFEIALTAAEPAKDGAQQMTHIMGGSGGKIDITDAPLSVLLENGAHIRRISGNLPKGNYNLHVEAPSADEKTISSAVELAVAGGTDLRIEHQTKTTDAYVLTAINQTSPQIKEARGHGAAFFDGQKTVQCVVATMDDVAAALESALGTPVVNESGLKGKVTTKFDVESKDLAAINATLQRELGLALSAAKRPIETKFVSGPDK